MSSAGEHFVTELPRSDDLRSWLKGDIFEVMLLLRSNHKWLEWADQLLEAN